MGIKVQDCTVELIFSIWDQDIKVSDVPGIIEEALDKAGYALSSSPSVVMVRERVEEI